tara:strand:- start:3382 stop:4371 length:990 start_codon:yes stop_codon:yes gene_type:complete
MSLKRFFNKINGIKVIIVGDVMVDSYTFGKIERNSPEAPVPIVNVENKENRIGGAANVALNIKSLGGIPYLCSCIGKDNYGKIFLELLEKNKISTDSIIIDSKRKTTVKERVIVKKNHIVRIDNETTNDLSYKFQKIVREKIFKLSKKCDLLIIQDYDKGLLNKNFINEIIKKLKNKITITVDPKFKNFKFYDNISLLKPNLIEACKGLNLNIKSIPKNKIGLAAQKYLLKKKIKFIMITMSKNGILIIDKKTISHFKTKSKDIVDVSGAGDTVIAIASICVYLSTSVPFLCNISNLAGKIVCQSSGVVPINKSILLDKVKENELIKDI